MRINKTKYKAGTENYYELKYTKSKILLTATLRQDMRHIKYLKYIDNGRSKKFPTFTVARDGKVYQHFNPAFYSDYTGNRDFDRASIVVSMDNAGWVKQEFHSGRFFNWAKEEVQESMVSERGWRNYKLWEKYTDAQYDSLIKLIDHLSDKYDIDKNYIGHNASEDNCFKFNGILSRSNLYPQYTDINPTFEFSRIMGVDSL